MRQTAAHRFIGLLSEAAQKPEERGAALGRSSRRLYNFYKNNQPVKNRVYYAKRIAKISNYGKKQTARKTKELSGKKNQN